MLKAPRNLASLALVFGLLAVGCGEEAPVAPAPPPPCPEGFVRAPSRTLRIHRRLESTEEGRQLVREAAQASVCYGAVAPSVVTQEHALLIDERLGDDEAAARFAHLLMHVAHGSPLRLEGSGDCEAKVAAALAAEGRALAAEVRLRDVFGVREPVGALPFEEADAEAIAIWLHAHPDGADGVAPLARDYLARCEVAR